VAARGTGRRRSRRRAWRAIHAGALGGEWFLLVWCVRHVLRCLRRFIATGPAGPAVAAPVELDVLSQEAHQSSGLPALRAKRGSHATPTLQELIRTKSVFSVCSPPKCHPKMAVTTPYSGKALLGWGPLVLQRVEHRRFHAGNRRERGALMPWSSGRAAAAEFPSLVACRAEHRDYVVQDVLDGPHGLAAGRAYQAGRGWSGWQMVHVLGSLGRPPERHHRGNPDATLDLSLERGFGRCVTWWTNVLKRPLHAGHGAR